MRPNDLRIRFLPVKVCAIFVPWDAAERSPRVGQFVPASTLEPANAGRTLEAPTVARGAPSHGRRAADHASRHLTREKPSHVGARSVHGNRKISRSSPDRTFRV